MRGAAALVAAATLVLAAPAGASAPRRYPTRLQVAAKEFYYVLSRHTVAAGPAIVQLVNFGEDPHDLRMQRQGGGRVYGTPIIQPGSIYDLSLTLLPGTYELWCSIADHRALGMQALLHVVPDAS